MADGGGEGGRRWVAGVVGLLLLAPVAWLFQAFLVPGMVGELGYAPPTGVVTVTSCQWRYVELTQRVVDCPGRYRPNGGGRAVDLTLQNAHRYYARGTRVPVRLVRGHPYQPSALRFGAWACAALALSAVPGHFLRKALRRPRTRRAARGRGLPIAGWVPLLLPAYLLLSLLGYLLMRPG